MPFRGSFRRQKISRFWAHLVFGARAFVRCTLRLQPSGSWNRKVTAARIGLSPTIRAARRRGFLCAPARREEGLKKPARSFFGAAMRWDGQGTERGGDEGNEDALGEGCFGPWRDDRHLPWQSPLTLDSALGSPGMLLIRISMLQPLGSLFLRQVIRNRKIVVDKCNQSATLN